MTEPLSCEFRPVNSVAVGSNAVSYSGRESGNITTTLDFAESVPGAWSEAGFMSNLTPTIICN